MLDLANKYWSWKQQRALNKPLKTDQGYTVVRFGEQYAVKASRDRYYDLVSMSHKWGEGSQYFRDCLSTKEKIEKRFGNIIEQ